MHDGALTTSRRAFAKTLATAAAAPALLPAVVIGQAAAPAATPTPTATGSPTTTPTPAPPSSAAEALTEIVRVRWGKHLTGEQLGDISKAIDGRLRGADAMKKVTLANGDEPDVVYSAVLEGSVP